MDLRSTQFKDTYGNLLTIGTVAGSPTTGTLENGDGEDITNLTVAGDITIADKIIHSGDTNTAIRFPSADTVTIETAGTERMRINSSGNVGIGTDTPDNKFHVVSGAAGEVAQFTGAVENRGLSIRSETNVDASALIVFNSQSGGTKGTFAFETDSTERMRIDSSGNLLVGTTIGSGQLTVAGAIQYNGIIAYSKVFASLDTTGEDVAGINASFNGASAIFEFTGSGGSGGFFHIIYSCYNSGGNWSYTKNVIDSGGSIDVTATASGSSTITFTFKSTSGTQGFTPRLFVKCFGNGINTTYIP
jgi:hypothetical protein